MKAFFEKGHFIKLALLISFSIIVLHACSKTRERRAVYVLADTSGIYNNQFDKIQNVMRHLLGALQAGESLAFARIDGESFNETDIVARMSFDLRPSIANSQKRAFLESVDLFGKSNTPGKYTDITGGILQAIEYLNETQAKQRYILILSDLKEEIKKGQVRNFPISFNGIHVAVINIAEQKNDIVESGKYLERVEVWTDRVEQGGGDWKLISDMERMDEIVE